MTKNTEARVEFGELPPDGRRAKWACIAEALRARPGEWARVTTAGSVSSATSTASFIRTGTRLGLLPVGAFEAVTRGKDVWARYIGPVSS